MCGLKSILLVQLSVAHCRGLWGGGCREWREALSMVGTHLSSPCFSVHGVQPWPWFGGRSALGTPSIPFPRSPAGSCDLGQGRLCPAPWGFWCSDKHRAGAASRMPIGRAAHPGAGMGGGGPARVALAFRVQRVTVAGRFGCLPGPGRSRLPACLPRSPPNHLVIGASCIPAGMGGCHGDGGCWLLSNIHPLAHPPRTNSACVLASPPIAGCVPLGSCGLAGVPMEPWRGCPGRSGSERGFPICWEQFPRNSLHDSPITPRRHIDLLLLLLRRPPPAWCLPGRWLTQPGT